MNTLPSSRANATTKKLGKVTPGRGSRVWRVGSKRHARSDAYR